MTHLISISRAVLICMLQFVLATTVCCGQDEAAGKRLFNEGVLADGSKLTATVENDLQLSGQFVACAKCHRRSGRGAQEGARLVPAIHRASLFSEKTPNRAQLFRNLYLEDHPPETDAQINNQPTRPPYGEALLKRVLVHGIDSNDQQLSPLMPKIQFERNGFPKSDGLLGNAGGKTISWCQRKRNPLCNNYCGQRLRRCPSSYTRSLARLCRLPQS